MSDIDTIREGLRTCTGRQDAADPHALALAHEMPYSHRIGRPDELFAHRDLNETVLRTRRDSVRAQIGTDNCVFLWLGASAYAQPACVLFLDPLIERDHPSILVAPWDTKGILGHGVLGRNVTPEEASRVIAEHSLPMPDARILLGMVLQLCYETPADYLLGVPPNRCYPGRSGIPYNRHSAGVSTDLEAAHTFEARVPGEVVLRDRIIAIVVDPLSTLREREAPRRLTGLRTWCRRHEVRLREVRPAEVVRDVVVEVAEAILRERGAL